VLGDDDPVGINPVQERQALLFELGRRNDLHGGILAQVRNSVHSLIGGHTMLAVLGVNLLGDGLRDLLAPRFKGVK
jgi:hypothetical protein